MRFCAASLVLLTLVWVAGCGPNVGVTGKVTFEDGTPLTVGEVRFETDTFTSSGKIQSDGTYRLGSTGVDDGIPKGTYGVTVRAMDSSGFKPGMRPDQAPPPKSLIDLKYGTVKTSGLTCDVNGATKFDITVQKPTNKK